MGVMRNNQLAITNGSTDHTMGETNNSIDNGTVIVIGGGGY